MVMIAAISIDAGTGYNKRTAEVKLASDKTSYERITVELTEEETAEIVKLVSEIIATRLRLPAIREKIEAAKAELPLLPDAEPVKPSYTCSIHRIGHFDEECPRCREERASDPAPDGYKPDEDSKANGPGFKSCEVHGSYVGDECPFCDKPYPKPDKDIPF